MAVKLLPTERGEKRREIVRAEVRDDGVDVDVDVDETRGVEAGGGDAERRAEEKRRGQTGA